MVGFVLRFILVLLTLGTLVVALFQSVGRVGFLLLDRLEPAVNELFAAQRIQVSGLQGDWRALNPVVRIERLDLPAGFIADVEVELDAVRTIMWSRPVARRLRVGDLDLALEKPAVGSWRLAGFAGGGGGLEPLDFILDSEQLEVTGNLAFYREGSPLAGIRIVYLGINRGGEHRHRLDIWNTGEDCASPCELRLDYHGKDGLWPLRMEQQRLLASAANFTLPQAWIAISALRISDLELSWRQDKEVSGGQLRLAAEQFGLPPGTALSTELQGAIRGEADLHQGSISSWQVRRGAEIWELPIVALRGDGELVQGWMEGLDLGIAAEFMEGALSGIEPAARWIQGLNLSAQAHNLRGYIRLPSGEFGYSATVDDVSIDPFNGMPRIRNGGGELLGHLRGVQISLNAQDMALHFPGLFTEGWQLPYAQGILSAWFGPGYIGLRGQNLRVEMSGTRAAGSFSLSRPADRLNELLALLISADGMSVDNAKGLASYRLPQALRDWIATGPSQGFMKDIRFAYQGQLVVAPGELGRRIELTSDIQGARVSYHPDWPEVRSVVGDLAVRGSSVIVNIDEGESAGVLLGGSKVNLVDNAASANLALEADLDAGDALNFARYTPLRQWITFLKPDWSATGPLRLAGDLHLPLKLMTGNREGERAALGPAEFLLEEGSADGSVAGEGEGSLDQENDLAAEDRITVRLRADLRGVDFDLPGYRISLERLLGSLRYRYPYGFEAEGVSGELFDVPVRIGATSDEQRVHLMIAGRASPADVWGLIDLEDPGFATGSFAYQADLGIAATAEQVTQLEVKADLEGMALDLPGPYRKAAAEPEAAEIRLQFQPDYTALDLLYREAAGWLHFADAPLRGAVGFGMPPPAVASDQKVLVLTGRVPYFNLEDVLPGEEGGVSIGLPLSLRNLRSDQMRVGDFVVTNGKIDGYLDADGFDLELLGDNVSGSFELADGRPLQVELSKLIVPVSDPVADLDLAPGQVSAAQEASSEVRDPLSPDIISMLPEADVVIEQLLLGESEFGSWTFGMRPLPGELRITELNAQVRGLQIESTDVFAWRAEPNETRFTGVLRAEDLRDVLPQWGYTPQVETKAASMQATVTWPGSPAAFNVLMLSGEVELRADDGRFLDVESGGGTLRIFSLLNFTTIAKRISLDFSDVSGKGVSFDKVRADVSLDTGLMTFVEPMEVDGTGSNFRVAGTVDLDAQILDNEMIVTLPVSKSLPWYGAYIAIANPIAGIGVLVGERVLRKPLEQFSSAKYEISGTLEDPQVKLVGVFDTSMKEAAEKGAEDKEAEGKEAEEKDSEEQESTEADSTGEEAKEKASDQEGPEQEQVESLESTAASLAQEADASVHAASSDIVARP